MPSIVVFGGWLELPSYLMRGRHAVAEFQTNDILQSLRKAAVIISALIISLVFPHHTCDYC